MKRKEASDKNRNIVSKEENTEEQLSSVHLKESHLALDYWATKVAEARATMARALSIDNQEKKERLHSPSYIEDPLLLLEYWAARSGEARARMEERLALASLSVSMEIALRESGDMRLRLDEILKDSSHAKSTLMSGFLF